jgi:hypothetical protein
MPRRRRILVLALAALAFVAATALVARVLTVGNAERNTVVAILRAQARGDERGVLARLRGCRDNPPCRAQVRGALASTRRPGEFKVLRYDGPGGVPLGGRQGTARIAWKAGRALSVVQCVKLRTDGDPVSGYSVRVVALGAPIARDGSC